MNLGDLTGLGGLATAASSLVEHFFPDKTQEEKDKLAVEMQKMLNWQNLTLAQIGVDQAEAQSSDRLQHWRGALGWVCVMAFAWHYVGLPVVQYLGALSVQLHWLPALPMPPDLSTSELSTILTGMLGLGGLHVAERFKKVS